MADEPGTGSVPMARRVAAEAAGAFVLVLGGCGAAVLSAGFPAGGIGLLGIAFAFGLAVLGMAYAVGHFSGGHFNPAVTVGLFLAGRVEARAVLPYVGAQLVGAVAGAAVLFGIAAGRPGYSRSVDGLGANGYGGSSPGGYSLASCAVAEVVFTAVFLLVILGVTGRSAPKGFGPLAIGLTLTLIHLVAIPVTGTSVNPARSAGPAVLLGGTALTQLWLFVVAPLTGAALAGLAARWLARPQPPA